MADQTTVRPVNALGGIAGNLVLPPVLAPIGPGVAAATVLWSGEMVGLDSSGNAVSASAAACVTVMGLARRTADNRTTGTPPTSGLAGAISCEILVGPYSVLGDGSITASTPYGTDLYVVDNQTVSTSDGGGTARLRSGYFVALDSNSNPVCMFGVASPSARAFGLSGGGSPAFKARAVVTTTSVASVVGTTTGTLTAGSNAALAADGVTLAAGDVVLLPTGVLGSLTVVAADSGPYVVTNPGAAGAKFVLTRPDWWTHGMVFPISATIEIGSEGTLFAGTSWRSFATPGGTNVVDTTDPKFYPGRVVQTLTLTASTVTLNNVPILSASKSLVSAVFQLAHGTLTSTVGYGVIAAPTPGALGTASAVIDALASGMGKNGSSDASDLTVTVINW